MSADISDDATSLEEMLRGLAIKQQREKAKPDTTYYTHCQWCGEPTEGGRKYCSYGVDSCATDANRRDDILARTTR